MVYRADCLSEDPESNPEDRCTATGRELRWRRGVTSRRVGAATTTDNDERDDWLVPPRARGAADET
eukprot:2135558-Pleurochrysis_carterae.AAC.1